MVLVSNFIKNGLHLNFGAKLALTGEFGSR